MKDNLARKPELTLVEGDKSRSLPVLDIVPELSELPTEANKPWWLPDGDSALWLTSLCIVLLVYALPLAWWLWPGTSTSASVNLQPPAAMVVELAPVPAAPPAPPEKPPGLQQAKAVPTPPEPEPLPEPELPPVPEVPKPEVPKPEVAVKPEPAPTPKPEAKPKEPPPKIEEPVEEAPPEEKSASSASAPPEAPKEDVTAAAPNQGVSAPVVDQSRMMNWQSSLMTRLNQVKRYPRSARRARHQGIVYLRFSMDRQGNVLSASIERSSGYPRLDEETLALVERAQPLPKPPEDMAGALEFVVPVAFFMNR